MKKASLLQVLTGFFILFTFYHTAEYWVLYRNNVTGFIVFQFLFFMAAFGIAKWLTGNGLITWGLAFTKKTMKQLIAGLAAGFAVYLLYFFVCYKLQVVEIAAVPSFKTAVLQFCYLGFGTALTSLSEDIVTRGYLYHFLNGKLQQKQLVAFSALVYVLNHIHRLDDGWQVWVYLFIMGVFLMKAFINTAGIWMTFGLHWSGNMVYHSTHNIISSDDGLNQHYSIYLYFFFLLLLVPVVSMISRQWHTGNKKKATILINNFQTKF